MFNPLEHQGIRPQDQLRDWRELDVEPIDAQAADPRTWCRIITMNAVETEAVLFNHRLARSRPYQDARRRLALTRYVESQQQQVVGRLQPGTASVLETTLAYEQTAVAVTAWAARHEPEDYLRRAYEFGVLEDFDHLYRYANLYEMVEHRAAERVVGGLTEVMPGRALPLQCRHPFDEVRTPYDKHLVDPHAKLRLTTVLAIEQQTMTYYMTVGPQCRQPIARRLYQEIGMAEQEHVTHYESLIDPAETWWERLVVHEYNECWLYHSFLQQETDPRIRAIWELHLNMELGQLQQAAEMLRAYEGTDPEQIVGDRGVPQPLCVEPAKDYLRRLLATQLELTKLGGGYVRHPHERVEWMRQQVGGGRPSPGEEVVERHRRHRGAEYRLESEGPHPVERLRMPVREAPTVPGDLVDVLLAQHARMEELFLRVASGHGEQRRGAFADLARLVEVHEQAEERLVHPLSRKLPESGPAAVEERIAEERQAGELLRELAEGGVDAPGFDEAVGRLHESVVRHNRYEERYELPYLRLHVPSERLWQLAAELVELESRLVVTGAGQGREP